MVIYNYHYNNIIIIYNYHYNYSIVLNEFMNILNNIYIK